MEIANMITFYGFIGWCVVTVIVAALWIFTGWLGNEMVARMMLVYRIETLRYWLKRLESEGTHCFKRPDTEDDV